MFLIFTHLWYLHFYVKVKLYVKATVNRIIDIKYDTIDYNRLQLT